MNTLLIVFLLLIVLATTKLAKKEGFLIWNNWSTIGPDTNRREFEIESYSHSEAEKEGNCTLTVGPSLGLSQYPHYDWNS